MTELADGFDRYARQTPYEVLGVTPDANATEIRDRRNTLQRDLNEEAGNPSERAKKMQEVGDAYDQLCRPGNRMRIDFFLLDPQLGQKQSEALAKSLTRPTLDVQGALKPRKITVTHAALLDDLTAFNREPPKVLEMHPRPMEIEEPVALPEPLAVRFDC